MIIDILFNWADGINPFMTEADIIEKPVRKSMDWFLYDISLRHERVKLDCVKWSKWKSHMLTRTKQNCLYSINV